MASVWGFGRLSGDGSSSQQGAEGDYTRASSPNGTGNDPGVGPRARGVSTPSNVSPEPQSSRRVLRRDGQSPEPEVIARNLTRRGEGRESRGTFFLAFGGAPQPSLEDDEDDLDDDVDRHMGLAGAQTPQRQRNQQPGSAVMTTTTTTTEPRRRPGTTSTETSHRQQRQQPKNPHAPESQQAPPETTRQRGPEASLTGEEDSADDDDSSRKPGVVPPSSALLPHKVQFTRSGEEAATASSGGLEDDDDHQGQGSSSSSIVAAPAAAGSSSPFSVTSAASPQQQQQAPQTYEELAAACAALKSENDKLRSLLSNRARRTSSLSSSGSRRASRRSLMMRHKRRHLLRDSILHTVEEPDVAAEAARQQQSGGVSGAVSGAYAALMSSSTSAAAPAPAGSSVSLHQPGGGGGGSGYSGSAAGATTSSSSSSSTMMPASNNVTSINNNARQQQQQQLYHRPGEAASFRVMRDKMSRTASIGTKTVLRQLPRRASSLAPDGTTGASRKQFYKNVAQRVCDVFREPLRHREYLASPGFADDVCHLAEYAAKRFETEPRVLRLESPAYVFGDVHGNLEDLHFFADHVWKLGVSLVAGHLVFLGDYVDRGLSSLEVVAYLFAVKVIEPKKVWLLRGNHETRDVNGWKEHYGDRSFLWQCEQRFGDARGRRVWDVVNVAFDRLPLAAVIDDDVFCVHGGLPRRPRDDTLVRSGACPQPEALDRLDLLDLVPKAVTINPADPESTCPPPLHQMASECVWSDPAMEDQEPALDASGFGESLRGGGTVCFGQKAIDDFLKETGCSFVMRAHEAHAYGVSLSKMATVFTIFSTSKDHHQGRAARAGCVLVDLEKLQVINRSPHYKNRFVHRRNSQALAGLSRTELQQRQAVGLVVPNDDDDDDDDVDGLDDDDFRDDDDDDDDAMLGSGDFDDDDDLDDLAEGYDQGVDARMIADDTFDSSTQIWPGPAARLADATYRFM